MTAKVEGVEELVVAVEECFRIGKIAEEGVGDESGQSEI